MIEIIAWSMETLRRKESSPEIWLNIPIHDVRYYSPCILKLYQNYDLYYTVLKTKPHII